MDPTVIAILLALYTCIGWGTIALAAVSLGSHMGAQGHPALPFIWSAVGQVIIALILVAKIGIAPLRVSAQYAASYALAFFWPTSSLAIVYAYKYAGQSQDSALRFGAWRFAFGRVSVAVVNAIAATYPATVSMPLLWYFFGESMSFWRVLWIFATVVSVIGVVKSS